MRAVPPEAVLGCIPVKEGAEIGWTPYKDSVKRNCPACGREVWVGPKQLEAHRQGVPIKCMVCLIEENPTSLGTMVPLTKKKMGE